MIDPVIITAVADGELGDALKRRFGADYEIVTCSDVRAAVTALDGVAAAGRHAALTITDVWLGGADASVVLEHVRLLHPQGIRCLIAPMMDRPAAELLSTWVSLDLVDHFINEPWGHPEVRLYPAVSSMLAEWRRAVDPDSGPVIVDVVAPARTARTHELRDLMARNNVPARFHDRASPASAALLAAHGVEAPVDSLVVITRAGVLIDPENAAIADQLGAATRPRLRSVDLAIVGGGPAGLSAAVYGASEGLETVVVERAAIGGQAGTSSHIRNYLGFAQGVSGTELASRAAEQAWQFGAEFVLINPVVRLDARNDQRWRLVLGDGATLDANVVVLATGVDYRRLDAAGVEDLAGAGVYYGAATSEAPAFAGKRVFVVGAGNSAGQAAVHLAGYAATVTVLVRGASVAASMSDYLVNELDRLANVEVRTRTTVRAARGVQRLENLELSDDGAERIYEQPADGLFILIGAAPHTAWLPEALSRDAHGFILTGADAPTDHPRLPFETTLPGVFAVGDVRAGSVKRVASAVGEGSICVSQVHRYLARHSQGAPA